MGYVKNRDTLLSTGEAGLRSIALDIAEAGIAAADPARAARRHLGLDGNTFRAGELAFDLSPGRRVFVIGAGKASYGIAKAVEEVLGRRIHGGIVTCKEGQEGHFDVIEMHLASHPVPGAASFEAAQKTIRLLKEVEPGDIVIACFTGGSSSLFADPVDGVNLEDKAETTRVLLTCGASIVEINAVRKHLSRVKGGKLIRSLPEGVHLLNLTVSDVIGDRMDCITDPTVPDASTFADARATLDTYGLWSRLPGSVTAHLRRAPEADETVRAGGLSHLHRTDVLLLRADAACHGAADAAHGHGLTPLVLSTFFEGDSSALARNLVAIAKQIVLDGNPVRPPCVLIGGGETTVATDDAPGEGGPNQEFAVSAALEMAGVPGMVALAMDTDGTDGPTQYAGGLADGGTAEAARRAGVDLLAALRSHDVTPALTKIGHIVMTGATGTNVNDLKLVLVAPGRQ